MWTGSRGWTNADRKERPPGRGTGLCKGPEVERDAVAAGGGEREEAADAGGPGRCGLRPGKTRGDSSQEQHESMSSSPGHPAPPAPSMQRAPSTQHAARAQLSWCRPPSSTLTGGLLQPGRDARAVRRMSSCRARKRQGTGDMAEHYMVSTSENAGGIPALPSGTSGKAQRQIGRAHV